MKVALEEYASATLNLSTTPPFTNLDNWRLKVEEGAQTWHYLNTDEERAAWPQTLWDRYYLGLALV
jgi:lanosterol synthase